MSFDCNQVTLAKCEKCGKFYEPYERHKCNAFMTSPIGDLTIDSKGLRMAIDKIAQLQHDLEVANRALKKACEIISFFDKNNEEHLFSNYETLDKQLKQQVEEDIKQ